MRNIFTPLFLLFAFVANAQDGELDAFNYGDIGEGKQTQSAGNPVLDGQQKIFILSDGDILQSYTVDNGGNNDFGIVRYNSDGSLETSFGTGGFVTIDFGSGDDQAYAMTVTSGNKIVVVGSSSGSFAIAVYNVTDGTPFTTFSGDGKHTQAIGTDATAYAVVESGGFITVGGTAFVNARYEFAVARFTSTGTLDANFDGNSGSGNGIVTTNIGGAGAFDAIYSMALQSDGKLVVAGQSQNSGGTSVFALARYDGSSGILDTGFDGDSGNGNGIVTTSINGKYDAAYSVAIHNTTGNIVVGGYTDVAVDPASDLDFAVVRYNSSGILDTGFDTDGVLERPIGSGDDVVYDVAVQPNGKILAAGSTAIDGATNAFAIIRVNQNGSIDNSFGEDATQAQGLTIIDFDVITEDVGYDIALGNNYIMFGGWSQNLLGTARLFNSSLALPIRLILFTASRLSNSVAISWQSAREQDVQFFEVERSSDGIHFSKIGKVAAVGNSSFIKHYSFEDVQPSGINFYRLKIVNTNNTFEYSRIIVVRFENLAKLLAFPNPVKSTLNLQITQPKGLVQMQLFDVSGRLIKAFQLESGGSTISTSVDVSNLKKGVYLLKVKDEVIKLVKE